VGQKFEIVTILTFEALKSVGVCFDIRTSVRTASRASGGLLKGIWLLTERRI